MRTHRFYKSSQISGRGNTPTVITIDEGNFIFSKFENMTVKTLAANTQITVTDPTTSETTEVDFWTQLPEYAVVDSNTQTDPTGQNDQGIMALKIFREDLKYKRLEQLKSTIPSGKYKTFTVALGYDKNETDYKVIYLDFYYWNDGNNKREQVTIRFENSEANQPAYVIRRLDIDSDITEYLFRLTDGLDWGKRTYMLLDFNPNQCVNKGVYVVLNAPFNNNIGWIDNNRKLVQAYNIGEVSEEDIPVNQTYGCCP